MVKKGSLTYFYDISGRWSIIKCKGLRGVCGEALEP